MYKMDEITKIYQSLNSDPGHKEGKAIYDSIPSLYRVWKGLCSHLGWKLGYF